MYLKIKNQLTFQWYAHSFFVSIIFIFTLSGYVGAQTVTDFNKYPENIHDSLYYGLFKSHYAADKNLARSYATKSLEIARKYHNSAIIWKSLNALGILHESQNSHDSALYYHTQALEISTEHNKPEQLMYTYCNLGIVYLNLGVIDQSLDHSFKSLKIATTLNQTAIRLSALHNIGFAYGKINNNERALEYYKEALTLMDNANVNNRSQTMINIAFTYINLEKYNDAIKIFKQIIEISATEGLVTEANYGLADAFFKQQDFSESKKYVQLAMRLSKEVNDLYFLAKSYHLTGEIFYAEKNYEDAIKNLEEGLLIAKKIKSTLAVQEIYLTLSKAYYDKGEYKKSTITSNNASAIKDSLFDEKFTENFKDVHLNIEKEKSNEIIQTKEAKIKYQQKSVIVAGIVAIVALLVVAFFWRASYLMRRSRDMQAEANKLIQKQNKDLERFGQRHPVDRR